MRGLASTIVLMSVVVCTACVGGPGAPEDKGEGDPNDKFIQNQQSVTENQGQRGQDSSSSTTVSPPPTSGCVADQCAQLTCTCGRFTARVRQCTAGRCATTCAEAGCSDP